MFQGGESRTCEVLRLPFVLSSQRVSVVEGRKSHCRHKRQLQFRPANEAEGTGSEPKTVVFITDYSIFDASEEPKQ